MQSLAPLPPPFDPLREGWSHFSDGATLDVFGSFYTRERGLNLDYALQVGAIHLSSGKAVHGGLLALMLDHFLGLNCLRQREEGKLVTSSLTVNYLRPVLLGDFVTGLATVQKSGRTASYVDGVLSVDGKAVATASAVFLRAFR